jgi:hypothetical protein
MKNGRKKDMTAIFCLPSRTPGSTFSTVSSLAFLPGAGSASGGGR